MLAVHPSLAVIGLEEVVGQGVVDKAALCCHFLHFRLALFVLAEEGSQIPADVMW